MALNPWVLLGLFVAWASSIAGTAWWFYGAGEAAEKAAQAREDDAAAKTREAAASAIAAGIAKLRPQITNIRQEVQREIETRVEYRDCRHPAGVVQRINAAITGSEPAGDRVVPGADAASR